MARSRGFSQARPRRTRRRTSWEEGPGGTGIQTQSASGTIIIGSGAQVTTDGLTLARLRGRLRMYLKSVTSIGDGMIGAFGIGVVEGQAFAVGVSATPTPVAEQEWDGWIYWTPIQVLAPTATEEFGNAGMSMVDFDVDTKAMRKLQEADTIYAVAEFVEVGAVSMDMVFDSRVLLFLP